MGILFRRKKIYYLLCVLAVLLICLSGDMIIINDKVYSVFRVILESPKEAVHMGDGEPEGAPVSVRFVISLVFSANAREELIDITDNVLHNETPFTDFPKIP